MIRKILKLLAILILLVVIYFGYIFGRQAWDFFKLKKYKEHLVYTASENVKLLKDTIYLEFLDERRTLHIFLPPGYENSDQKYPVIYMLDGESLFDDLYMQGPEWQLDERIESVMAEGGPGAIVVGIENGDRRSEEYKPFAKTDSNEEVYGSEFSRFLVHDLKPWIDMRFKTKRSPSHTIIGGASLGGLMAYYILMTYPETFGKAIVMSPSFWVSDEVFRLHYDKDLSDKKIFISIGTEENDLVGLAKRTFKVLEAAGMTSDNLRLEKQRGFSHNHFTWRDAFKKAYPWIIE
ncbi:MAG: hypothetical protein KJO29_03175 [Bacteroidia bacterium]|nr:hypothetical protein [Bacteroidia bacterium]